MEENKDAQTDSPENTTIKRTFILNKDKEYKVIQDPKSTQSAGKTVLLVIVLILILGGLGLAFKLFGGFSMVRQIIEPAQIAQATPEPTPDVSPTPAAPVLERSEVSFEVLNGSGVAGAAKSIASKIEELGYPVVKTGNADKDNYSQTQIFVREEFQDKTDLVIADLKDVIKIASLAGELTTGTASARIIIGKDIK